MNAREPEHPKSDASAVNAVNAFKAKALRLQAGRSSTRLRSARLTTANAARMPHPKFDDWIAFIKERAAEYSIVSTLACIPATNICLPIQ